MSLFLMSKVWRVRLELDRDSYGRATMVKTFLAHSAGEARELARLELGLTWREAVQRLTVEEA